MKKAFRKGSFVLLFPLFCFAGDDDCKEVEAAQKEGDLTETVIPAQEIESDEKEAVAFRIIEWDDEESREGLAFRIIEWENDAEKKAGPAEKFTMANNCRVLSMASPILSTMPVQYGTHYPFETRFLSSKEIYGNSVVLDDGSEWKIARNHAYEVAYYWGKDDPVVATPSVWPGFTGNRFFLTNLRTGSWVYADIAIGPLVGGYATFRVVDVDTYYGRVLLEDGKHTQWYWEVDPMHIYMIKDWIPNQAIFLGSSEDPMGFRSSTPFNTMLLNIERNNFVFGRRY